MVQISQARKTEGRGMLRTGAGAALLGCAAIWAAACNGGGDGSEFVAEPVEGGVVESPPPARASVASHK